MKQNLYCVFLLISLIFLLHSSTLYALPFENKQGNEKEIEASELVDKVMGLERCEKGEEECLKRRIMAEAHLDYIYTQHHNNP